MLGEDQLEAEEMEVMSEEESEIESDCLIQAWPCASASQCKRDLAQAWKLSFLYKLELLFASRSVCLVPA